MNWGVKRGKGTQDLDRRAARAEPRKPPLCSFYLEEERRGYARDLKKQEVVGPV